MTASKATKTALVAGLDYTGITCVAIILTPKKTEETLLLRRSIASIIEPGLYELPQAILQFQSTPLEALCEGVKQQTNLIIQPYHQAPILCHIIRGQHWLQIPYLAKLEVHSPPNPNLRLNRNYIDYTWTTPQNALKKHQLTKGTEHLLKTYITDQSEFWHPK